MKKIAFAAAMLSVALAPALAAEPVKISVKDAMALAAALRNLDGHLVVSKQNGAEASIMIPWEFASGSLRLRIANDLTIVSAVEASMEKVRQSIVKEIQKSRGVDEIKPGTPEYLDFLKQYGEALDGQAPGTQDLARIKASELKLDRNEIAVTVLQALKPILDMDVSP